MTTSSPSPPCRSADLFPPPPRTDLRGATALGRTPYLQFTRSLPDVSSALPPRARAEIADQLDSILSPVRIDPVVIASVTGCAIFVETANRALTSKPARSILFDPHAFTEELCWVQHQLVTQPGPLRRSSGSVAMCAAVVDVSKLKTENYVLNHQLPLSAPVIPAPHHNFLEPVLRICCLLYLKELMPDFPRNLGGYSVLLTLLRAHLKDTRRRCLGTETTRDVPLYNAARPVMLWVCLVGNTIARIADGNECRFGSDRYDRTVFSLALADFMEGVEGGIDGLDDDRDFTLCRLLALSRIRGESWNDRVELKRLLEEKRQ